MQVGHQIQISLGKVCIFSTSRPPLVRGTSLTSLHRQALVFPVFVWLSITAASTSGILFSSGTQGKPNSQLATQQKQVQQVQHLNLVCFSSVVRLKKVVCLKTLPVYHTLPHSQTHKNTRFFTHISGHIPKLLKPLLRSMAHSISS